MTARRGRRLALVGIAVVAGIAAAVAVARLGSSAGSRSDTLDELPLAGGLPADLVLVEGNPGWESLPEEERDRARTPLSDAAREWLTRHRAEVLSVADTFDVSPVALGGIVAAEKTLLVSRADELGESLLLAVFGTLREGDLEGWVAEREREYRTKARAGDAPERERFRTPYLWTLGPAQVSFRLAVRIEPQVATALGRPRRTAREVLTALTTVRGSLEYAAALLAQSRGAYARIAGLDIGENPGVLATVYHLGAPTVRARRLAGGAPGEELPHVNYYGAWVNLHAEDVARLLGVPPTAAR
ncbi:MAG TPA: DUF1402 family protein [Gemmatimonadota bacterium]|nr:DUF1402 family protein [Gemmatimonadota bacterium]